VHVYSVPTGRVFQCGKGSRMKNLENEIRTRQSDGEVVSIDEVTYDGHSWSLYAKMNERHFRTYLGAIAVSLRVVLCARRPPSWTRRCRKGARQVQRGDLRRHVWRCCCSCRQFEDNLLDLPCWLFAMDEDEGNCACVNDQRGRGVGVLWFLLPGSRTLPGRDETSRQWYLVLNS
jgi:hypothetical protein